MSEWHGWLPHRDFTGVYLDLMIGPVSEENGQACPIIQLQTCNINELC